jgi:histidine triad (HIT) family protein
MPINDEQAKNIKEQLFKQIESFPEEKKKQITDFISGMNNEQLEEFLIKNKMMRSENEESEGEESEKKSNCIYCMIGKKQIETLILYEDEDYLSVLEINPISEGHAILVPKEHISEVKSLKPKAFTIADKIGKHIIKKLKADDLKIESSDSLKHAIINIVPIYKGKELAKERKPADKKQLQELALKIGKIEIKKAKAKEEKPEEPTKKSEEKKIEPEKAKQILLKLPRRIP